MRINNNLQALNAWRQLTQTDSRLSKSLERLSSGMRINRAADDAAGLAVSEKMRAQIRSMDQAIRNAQDGISLIQTAEGALQEDSAILQRMRELSLQASSDTLTDGDRLHLQKEVDQLVAEFDRISKTTEFNTALLLTGEYSNKSIQIGPNSGSDYQLSISFQSMTAMAVGLVVDAAAAVQASADIGAGDNGTVTVTADTAGVAGNAYSVEVVGGVGNDVAMSAAWDGDKIVVTLGTDGTGAVDGTKNTAALVAAAVDALAGVSASASGTGATALAAEAAKDFAGGADATDAAAISISTRDKAQAAIATLDAALNKISSERATMGAWQNRLEHTITNLGISVENLTAAESRMRDVDMAAEMMAFTKNQILIQSGTAMLAQANLKPQSILQLLA